MAILIFYSTMAFLKALCSFPFIYNWMLNYPDVFLDTNLGRIVVLFTFFLCVHVLPFLPALYLLSLISLHMPCTIHPCFKEMIPSAVFSFVDAKITAADPTGRVSALSRRIWKAQDSLIISSSAMGLLLACYGRFYGLLSCFSLSLLSLGMYIAFRFAATSTQPLDHESSLGSVPTEEQEKGECEEMTLNPIDGSIPSLSLKIEEVELEKSLMTNTVPLNVDTSLDSVPLDEVEKDGFEEKPSNSNQTSTSDGDEWFQMERDGLDNAADTGGEVNRSPSEDRNRLEKLITRLHPRLWRSKQIPQ